MERWSCGARVTVTSVRAFLFLTESRTEATEAVEGAEGVVGGWSDGVVVRDLP